MDPASIDLLDDLDEHERCRVKYTTQGVEAVADGRYAGFEKNSIGQQCIALNGPHESRIRIPVELVKSITRR